MVESGRDLEVRAKIRVLDDEDLERGDDLAPFFHKRGEICLKCSDHYVDFAGIDLREHFLINVSFCFRIFLSTLQKDSIYLKNRRRGGESCPDEEDYSLGARGG